MAADSRAVRYLVSGRVQGVFYRVSAAAEAKRLHLAGWARNLTDGRVEVVAVGDARALSELAAWLWRGPPAAVVDGVRVEEWSGGGIPSGFDIR
jgi:acylphosphatase